MSKTDLWLAMLEEVGKIGDWIGDTMSHISSDSLGEINKARSKELVQLGKKEPNIIKLNPQPMKHKDIIFHLKVPKEKEQKFFNRHMKEDKK